MSAAPVPAPLPRFIPPTFENMPAELRQRANWLLWVALWVGLKWTKRPIQLSGFGASTTNPDHWSSFEDVRRAYERGAEQGGILLRERTCNAFVPIGGVGFVFDNQPDEHGLVLAGIDFDRVLSTDGKIALFAAERIKRLRSYCEFSVSGGGLHVITKARPLRAGISHDGVEIYTGGRYFTMTGRTGSKTRTIVPAEAEVAALVEELLRGKSGNARAGSPQAGGAWVNPDGTGYSRSNLGSWQPRAPLLGTSDLAAGIETSAWFDRLSSEARSNVIRHAVSHIAKASNLFQLTQHGGNYQEYFKVALAIARSGVPDAEDIFVQAALTASDADPEQKLRDFFRSCECAQPQFNSVTVGTLLHHANQCGADFSQWKRLVDARAVSLAIATPDNDDLPAATPDVAQFVPGNEEQCRRLLDGVVAKDPRTFTLGDPAGPLTILRVPDEKTLPAATRWEGDLPGTTLATPADIMQRAERLTWMRKSEGRLVRTRPPRDFITDYLTQKRGQYGAPPLRGVVRVPHIDDSGEIRFVSGYDSQTGLFHDKSPAFDVPSKPSQDDARKAANVLTFPFSKYKFEDHKAGQALLLTAIFTAIERPFLPVAPMLVMRSSMPGTGKGLIVRSLVRLAFDTVPVIVTWGGTGEEFEKRLAALLLQVPGALSIDNANSMQVQGDLLESIITEGCADIRPLGRSEMVKVRSRSFVTLTGNNPIITGDMARRSLVLDIQPRSADPERDRYGFNPVEVIGRRRTDFLRAAFVCMRAFRLCGMPSQGLPAVGSFEEWSRKVRDLVFWLTAYDVSDAFRRNKMEDPRRQRDASLLAALHQHFGASQFKSAEAILVHQRVADSRRFLAQPKPTATERTLAEAIDDVLGARNANAKAFGYWAMRVKGAHNGGFILDTHHDTATNAKVISVRRA
jgi:putative DNA primase/helicase